MGKEGIFQWKRRMGIHYAYHQRLANRLVHHFCIPMELMAVSLILSLLPNSGYFNPALIVLTLVAVIYVLVEPVAGLIMTAALYGLHVLSMKLIAVAGYWSGPAAVLLFLASFNIQMSVGHRCLEPGTEVEGERNFAEFFRTRNPVPLLLIFYYHLIELLLLTGYRPGLRKDLQAHARDAGRTLGFKPDEEAWP